MHSSRSGVELISSPQTLGYHDHLGWVHPHLALFSKEDLCQKDVPVVNSFILGLVVYHKGVCFHYGQPGHLNQLEFVTGIIIVFGEPARVLFDSAASQSFISSSFALHAD